MVEATMGRCLEDSCGHLLRGGGLRGGGGGEGESEHSDNGGKRSQRNIPCGAQFAVQHNPSSFVRAVVSVIRGCPTPLSISA